MVSSSTGRAVHDPELVVALFQLPKTGSVTLNRHLRGLYGWRHADVEPVNGVRATDWYGSQDHRWTQRVHPRLVSIAGHRVLPGPRVLAGRPVHYGVVIRDPVDRCLSHYRYYRQHYSPEISVEQFLAEDRHRDVQCSWLHPSGQPEAAFEVLAQDYVSVGVFPDFAGFLRRLGAATGRPELVAGVPHLNRSSRAPMNEADRARVLEANRDDVALFRLVTEHLLGHTPPRSDTLDVGLIDPSKVRSGINTVWRNVVYRPALRIERARRGVTAPPRRLRLGARLRGRL